MPAATRQGPGVGSGQPSICRQSIFVCLIALCVGGCYDPAPPQPTGEMPPAAQVPNGTLPHGGELLDLLQLAREGIEFAQLDATLPVFVSVIDHQHFSPGLTSAPQEGISVRALLEQHTSDDMLIIGSGFVSHLHSLRPVGLLKQQDRVLNPLLAYGYTRILGIDPTDLSVIHKDDYEPGLFDSALQVGPGVIEDGRLDIAERDLQKTRFFRSFVALCDAHWLLGISLAPSNLYNIGSAVQKWATERSLGCHELVNLAGDRQAVFAARIDQTTYFHGDITTAKVSLLTFRPVPVQH